MTLTSTHLRWAVVFLAVGLFACSNSCEEPATDDEPPNVERLHFGTYHVCVLDDQEHVWCTGQNSVGQLGDGTTRTQDELVQVAGLEGVRGLSVGLFDTNCAFDGDGQLWCWGNNSYGVLANDDLEFSAEPRTIDDLPAVIDVSLGAFHACAVTEDGELYCWGRHDRGQLGIGTDQAAPVMTTPQRVEGFEDVRKVRAGGAHTCALTEDGEVYCWGSNEFGQLGLSIDRTPDVAEPQNISQFLPGKVHDLDVAFHHSCALVDEERQLYCWGANDYGQFGLDDLEPRLEPTMIPDIAYVDEWAVGGGQVCVSIDDDIYCAGEVIRPVEMVEQTGEGFVFRKSPLLEDVTELWSGVLAICGPNDDETIACRGVEHQGLGEGMF